MPHQFNSVHRGSGDVMLSSSSGRRHGTKAALMQMTPRINTTHKA
jgi:hypothetical protein